MRNILRPRFLGLIGNKPAYAMSLLLLTVVLAHPTWAHSGSGSSAAGTRDVQLIDFESGIPSNCSPYGTVSITGTSGPSVSPTRALHSVPSWTGDSALICVFSSGHWEGLLSAWFWDDGIGLCPLPLFEDDKIQYVNFLEEAAYPVSVRGVGIHTEANQCTYSYRVDGDSHRSTGIPRHPGWHLVTFTWSKGVAVLALDGVPVHRDLNYPYQPDKMLVGHAWGEWNGQAWYDDLTFVGN